MIKNSIAALVAAAAFAGIAVPVFASPVLPDAPVQDTNEIDTAFGGGSSEMRAFIADSVLTELNRRGINATAVEDWSGLIRAYVTLDDGSQVMQFYTPDSLQPVLL